MKASDLFIKCLEEEGCEYVFGIPGEENLDFLDSLSRSEKIKLILTRHEQGAGFMASVYGRLTGHTGVCLATLSQARPTSTAAYAQLGGCDVDGDGSEAGQEIRKVLQILDVVDMMLAITSTPPRSAMTAFRRGCVRRTALPKKKARGASNCLRTSRTSRRTKCR